MGFGQRYKQWMYEWETRLTTRDTNRVVRPLDWGAKWTAEWPCRNGSRGLSNPEDVLIGLNQQILKSSDEFFSYRTPSDFRVELQSKSPNGNGVAKNSRGHAQFLRFTSAVETPYAENNTVNARWFPARGRRAVVVLPQWNSDAEGHNGLCRIFNVLGISALRLSLPYHDVRKPPEIERADYAVSANIGRTIDAARQAVIDVRCCLDWLDQQGYLSLGIVGTSLGSCYAFIAAAHEPRLRTCVFNHASTYFADVVWTGQSTRQIRAGIEDKIDLDRLRQAWLAISPMSYFDAFQRYPRKSLLVYASYDLTFLPEFSQQIVDEFRRRQLDCKVAVLPCGHYSCGEAPFKYMDAWYMARFLEHAL
ncbi:MAG TPA: abhydrolase domain-containing 18 [Terriglobales bacterium]|nr:abhydrolase domain-containing 18 [Terriglobales bacterium]